MRIIPPVSWLSLLLVLMLPAACGAGVDVVARFTPEAGVISDAAITADGRIILAYPGEGRIAVYSREGKLIEHIVREAGSSRRFIPTICLGQGVDTIVFDEAARKVFTIARDGNFTRSVELAYPHPNGEARPLDVIDSLVITDSGGYYALLPGNGELAAFDATGHYLHSVEFGDILPYSPAVYTRASLLGDGSIFLMDYQQGAVLYRSGAAGPFRRLMLAQDGESGYAIPQLQDYAVDEAKNVLLATYDNSRPLVLLSRDEDGYEAHNIRLKLPKGESRLACRYSAGKFIVWHRDTPFVAVISLR